MVLWSFLWSQLWNDSSHWLLGLIKTKRYFCFHFSRHGNYWVLFCLLQLVIELYWNYHSGIWCYIDVKDIIIEIPVEQHCLDLQANIKQNLPFLDEKNFLKFMKAAPKLDTLGRLMIFRIILSLLKRKAGHGKSTVQRSREYILLHRSSMAAFAG